MLSNVPTGNIPFLLEKFFVYSPAHYHWAFSNKNLTFGFDTTMQVGVHINLKLSTRHAALITLTLLVFYPLNLPWK